MAVFVYGSYTTEIDSLRPKDAICPDCNAKNQIGIHKMIEVIHFMYVPIIPIRIENVVHCKSCEYEFSLKGLDKESSLYWKRFKSSKWTPIYYYSGPLLILLLLGYSLISQMNNESKMLERLENGNQKQFIEYEKENGSFSIIKTIKINKDSIWYFYNEYEIQDYRFIDKIAGDNLYSADTTKADLETIKELINDGKVKVIYTQ